MNTMKMSKYQEALDWVSAGNDSCGTEWDFLQELVDKETPMKPYSNSNTGSSCRLCDEPVSYGVNFCENCGIRLDWGDV
mgnify:CR=1 FL=1